MNGEFIKLSEADTVLFRAAERISLGQLRRIVGDAVSGTPALSVEKFKSLEAVSGEIESFFVKSRIPAEDIFLGYVTKTTSYVTYSSLIPSKDGNGFMFSLGGVQLDGEMPDGYILDTLRLGH